MLYGSGYVLVAFLEGGLVEDYGWLTQGQLLDAIAIGQFTPGPVLSTSTFIGYLIEGVPGAAVATLGIFLPSFLFVLMLNPLIPKLRQSVWLSAFLDAVNAAAVALMAAVTLQLGVDVLVSWPAWVIAGSRPSRRCGSRSTRCGSCSAGPCSAGCSARGRRSSARDLFAGNEGTGNARSPATPAVPMSALPSHVRVAIIGSGFAGLGAAIRLKQEGEDDFVVLERADAVGGVWRDNRYPGAACDVQSHLY